MIRERLINRKSTIIKKWTDSILSTYPPESSDFLKSKKNQFGNPVGYTITKNAELIYDEIVNERDHHKIKLLIDEIVRLRAVQNFTPSQAVGFIFSLKKIVHDELNNELGNKILLEEFLNFESFIDCISLLVFDSYMESREKIYRIRVNEIKSGSINNSVSADSN